jgi:hypothetical protein
LDQDDVANRWVAAFRLVLEQPELSGTLRTAAIDASLRDWTRLLTKAVIRSCIDLSWSPAAKGHRLALLPQPGQEYLGIDVMAFPPSGGGGPQWPLPLAVFELENLKERAAYSLWKVICVRASLRVVFAYRNDWEQVRTLVRDLTDEVIAGLTVEERQSLGDNLLLVTGSRGEGETFPYGYFKIWRLNPNTANFEKFPGWG